MTESSALAFKTIIRDRLLSTLYYKVLQKSFDRHDPLRSIFNVVSVYPVTVF